MGTSFSINLQFTSVLSELIAIPSIVATFGTMIWANIQDNTYFPEVETE